MNKPDTVLLDALFDCGAVKVRKAGEEPFRLKSGATSDVYVDVRRAALTPRGLNLIAGRIYGLLSGMGFPVWNGNGIGCDDGPGPMLILGAVLVRFRFMPPVAFVRRKSPKSHGTANEIEGTVGTKPVIIEDVITTGGSVESIVRAIGVEPVAVVCVVDRREAAGWPPLAWPVYSLVTLTDVRVHAAAGGKDGER